MYKRPLFAAAIGFVLGEVCAWWAESGKKELGIVFVLGVFAVFCLRNGGQRMKKSRSMHNILWMLLLLCVFFTGYGRMAGEIRKWDNIEEGVWEDGEAVEFWGKVKELREKEKNTVFTVETEEMGNVLVYVEKEEIEKGEVEKGGIEKEKTEKEKPEIPKQAEESTEMPRIGEMAYIRGECSHFQQATNPGQFDLKAYYRSQGILVSVFAWEMEWGKDGGENYSPYLDALYRFRRFCSRIFAAICEEGDAGIFRAAILGEKDGMEREIKDLYQKNGIAHLLAISGLHLSLIGAGLHRLLRKCGLGYGLSGMIATVGIFSYGLLTGASGSAMRAVIMLSVSFLAAYLGRTYDLLSALSLAALLLAGSQPFSITQSGFQLSFGAVLGIGVVGKVLERGLKAEKPWVKGLIISLSVQLATGPIVLWNYFQLPAYGVFLNLMVVPLMSYVVISGLLGLGAGAFSLWAGVMAVGTGHYILQFYQWLCERVSCLPGYLLIWGRPKAVQIVLYYLFLGAMLWVFNREAQRQKQGENKENRAKSWGILAAGMFFCCLCMKPRPQEGLDITVLDVGQGDGIVIQCEGGTIETEGIVWLEADKRASADKQTSADKQANADKQASEDEQANADKQASADKLANVVRAEEIERLEVKERKRITILMDGGSTSDKRLGENRLEPYLKFEGISQIDFAIVSHGDEDHISGLRYLLNECPEIKISCLLLPEAGREDEGYGKLIAAARKRKIPVGYMDAGDKLWAGACRFTCFYPGKDMEVDVSDRNQQSLVLRADYQDFHMLFTGDVGQEGEKLALEYASAYALQHKDEGSGEEGLSCVQVLKAAHHGSRLSSGEEFLTAVRPLWTVISYQEGNSYGHPHEETLERLQAQGSLTLETGKMGAILLHVEDGKARYQGWVEH